MVSSLRLNVGLQQRKIKSITGFRGQLESLRKSVTALIVNERLEMPHNKGYVTRQYTEKLISDALLNGDKHKHTMEMATWWLQSVIYKCSKNLQSIKKSPFPIYRIPVLFTNFSKC